MSVRRIAAALFAGGIAAAAVAADAPSFNGVWQLEGPPIEQLRTAEGRAPPLLPAARRVQQERAAKLAAGDRSWDPAETCRPLGNPRALWERGWPFDLQVTAQRILFAYTWNRLHRLVDVRAGEPMPAGPSYFGTSTAQLQGTDLTVRSSGYHATTLIDAAGLPHSEELSLVERYQLLDGGRRMELRIRFHDPKVYSRDWDAVARFRRVPDGRIREDVCEVRQGLYQETRQD